MNSSIVLLTTPLTATNSSGQNQMKGQKSQLPRKPEHSYHQTVKAIKIWIQFLTNLSLGDNASTKKCNSNYH